MPLTALPVRVPGPSDPNGIGGWKTNLRPLVEALRSKKLPADEVNRWLNFIVAFGSEIGLTDGTTEGSLRESVLGGFTGAVTLALGEVPPTAMVLRLTGSDATYS